jgi:hypothetical protein
VKPTTEIRTRSRRGLGWLIVAAPYVALLLSLAAVLVGTACGR